MVYSVKFLEEIGVDDVNLITMFIKAMLHVVVDRPEAMLLIYLIQVNRGLDILQNECLK